MKRSIYAQTYQGIQIKADCRIHEETALLVTQYKNGSHTLLDIACGEGALSQRLKDQFPELEIDVNDLEINQIKFNRYRQKFNINLNGPIHFSQKYDLITAIEIAEHIESPQQLLIAMEEHLNAGGKIILSTPETDSIYDRLNFLLKGRFLYFTDHHYHESGHITPIARWQMEIYCRKAKLRILDQIAIPWHMRFLSKALRVALMIPFLPLMKNVHQRSINIFILEKSAG